jgi:coatomer protein complex subunit epsilon
MGDRDILFAVRNSFVLGAYNNAINEASDIEGLSDAEALEKDAYVYRSYIALGSYDVSNAATSWQRLTTPPQQLSKVCPVWIALLQLVISEIADTAAMGLVAIKLLAKYLGGKEAKVRRALHESPGCSNRGSAQPAGRRLFAVVQLQNVR